MTRDESQYEALGALEAARWLFSLAYFILRDKKDALGAVYQAFARVGLVAQAQRKKEQKARKGELRQKISLDRFQMLQYLTYLSANVYEKIQEEQHLSGSRPLTEEDMVVRYVKQLVMLYMTTNSLFATVGQSCVLFDLSTSEADLLYETVVQASETVLSDKGDYSIRNAKRRIWTVLLERFEPFVSGYNGPRGERRLRLKEDASESFRVVKKSLHRMKPPILANGRPEPCPVPARFVPTDYDIQALQSSPAAAKDGDLTEMRRIHATVHPCCLSRIFKAHGYRYSRRSLRIPEFQLGRDGDGNNMETMDRERCPELTPAELSAIPALLGMSSGPRRRGVPAQFQIVVDGSELAQWESDEARISVFVDQEDKELEVFGCRGGKKDLMAVLLLQYHSGDLKAGTPLSVGLDGGQQFTFRVSGSGLDSETGCRMKIDVSYEEHNPARAITLSFRRLLRAAGLGRIPSAVAGAAAALVTLLIVLAPFAIYRLSRPHGLSSNSAATISANKGVHQDESTSGSPIPGQYGQRYAKDNLRPGPAEKESSEPGKSNSVNRRPGNKRGQMPGAAQHGDEPKYLADAGVGNRQPGLERSGDKPDGLTLNQIHLIYVDPLGGDAVGNELLRSRLSAVLGTSQTFATTRQRATADAVIKGNITATESEVSVDMRLVNAAGQVIWRHSARRMGNLDESVATSIASALVEDLARASMEMKVRQ